MSYAYEDLDDSQFERLVVQVMRKLFGAAVQSFATGPDGGRDALFYGTAERFPSAAVPWVGQTVGQAKHTNAINAHFSDPKFSGDADGATLAAEIPRVRRLVESGDLDNYILFSNRRLGGVTGPALTRSFADAVGLGPDRVFLAGIEYLDDMLHLFPDLLHLAKVDPVDGPLVVSSRDCAEVILAVADALAAPMPEADAPPVDRVSYERKNELNAMSNAFAGELSKRFLVLTRSIERFLADPANSAILAHYEAAVDDFQLKIVAKRESYQSFDDIFNYLCDLLFVRDAVLARHKRLTRALVFYMYWHCDIGKVPDAASQ